MARSDFNKAASAKSNFSKFGEPPHTVAPKRFDSEQTPRNSAPTLPLERSSERQTMRRTFRRIDQRISQ